MKNTEKPEPKTNVRNPASPAPFVWWADWRYEDGRSMESVSSFVVMNLVRCERMRVARTAMPELSWGELAVAALKKINASAIERVSQAVKQAIFKELADRSERLREPQIDPDALNHAMASLQSQMEREWAVAWRRSVETEFEDGAPLWVSGDSSIALPAALAPQDEQSGPLLRAIAQAAAAEFEALAIEAFGQDAVVASSSLGLPSEKTGATDFFGWVAAAVEQDEIKREMSQGGAQPNRAESQKDKTGSASARSQPNKIRVDGPREMLAWQFWGVSSLSGGGRFSSIAGIDLSASPVIARMLQAAPQLTLQEAAGALIGSRAAASRIIRCFSDEAQKAGFFERGEAATEKEEEDAVRNAQARWQRQCELRSPTHSATSEQLEKNEGVRLSSRQAWPEGTPDAKGVGQTDEDRVAAEGLAQRVADEMGRVAEELFGADCVEFAEAMNSADAPGRLIACAQRKGIAQAAWASGEEPCGARPNIGRRGPQTNDRSVEKTTARAAQNPSSEIFLAPISKKPKKARSL